MAFAYIEDHENADELCKAEGHPELERCKCRHHSCSTLSEHNIHIMIYVICMYVKQSLGEN